jgi:glutaminase
MDSKTEGWTASRDESASPLQRFLADKHRLHAAENSGSVADYIPELGKADPRHFGIGLATLDGHVYEVGDSRVAFTIQSISKAFVFALALELVGIAEVEAHVGVEPSGEAFNSIRLNAANRPFNAMVNAGAIACSGLIYKARGEEAFGLILECLSRLAGRTLDVDEDVFASERATGDRNRAIAYMLRNYNVIKADVDAVLDVYFRQCSILVTARDLAVMATALANGGINPVTRERVLTRYAVARTLSVMTSSGMYDYAGEWIYRVGIPAKSGVGGGIIAALPAQLGLGTFSPLLDVHGNSVRGIKMCEALSADFGLHVLNRTADVTSCIIADYTVADTSSRRNRRAHELRIIADRHAEVRILELIGALNFASVDYISRRLHARAPLQILILDFRRVPTVTDAAARLLLDGLDLVAERGTIAVLAGLEDQSQVVAMIAQAPRRTRLRRMNLLDEAIEWAEDQIVYRYGGYEDLAKPVPLDEQELLEGLAVEELQAIGALGITRRSATGERIVAAGDEGRSIFFLLSGMVSVKLPTGVRLATVSPGLAFGELALLEQRRTADVWADLPTTCLEVPLEKFSEFCVRPPQAGQRITRNLAALLARRVIRANNKIDLLTAY